MVVLETVTRVSKIIDDICLSQIKVLKFSGIYWETIVYAQNCASAHEGGKTVCVVLFMSCKKFPFMFDLDAREQFALLFFFFFLFCHE